MGLGVSPEELFFMQLGLGILSLGPSYGVGLLLRRAWEGVRRVRISSDAVNFYVHITRCRCYACVERMRYVDTGWN